MVAGCRVPINPRGRPFDTRIPAGAFAICAGTLLILVLQAVAATRAYSAPPKKSNKGAPATAGKGTNSRAAKEEALRAIPLSKLSRSDRKRVEAIVKSPSIYRRLPTEVIECDEEYYRFLLENPDLVVDIWRILRISEVELKRDSEGRFHADDHAGTKGVIEYLYTEPNLHILYADGTYEGPMFSRKVEGKCVLVIKSSPRVDANGKSFVSVRLDAFMDLDHWGISILAKTFQPLIGQMADHNFKETVDFLATMDRSARTNPLSMHNLAAQFENVPEEVAVEFLEQTDEIASARPLPAIVNPKSPAAAASQAANRKKSKSARGVPASRPKSR